MVRVLSVLAALTCSAVSLAAEPEPDATAAAQTKALKEANNPLSNLTSFSFQDYANLRLSNQNDTNATAGLANQFWFRVAKSIGDRVLVRASLPVLTSRQGVVSGLGDMNIIIPVIVTKIGAPTIFGIGPSFGFPTHTDPALGLNGWGLGGTAVIFNAGPIAQIGGLLTYNYNVGTKTEADKSNFMAAQPFLFFMIGKGFYVRSSAIMTFDFQNNLYNLPLGLGIGKIIPIGSKVIMNFYVEGQQSIYHFGDLQPLTQIFFGGNVQLVPKKKSGKKKKKKGAPPPSSLLMDSVPTSPYAPVR